MPIDDGFVTRELVQKYNPNHGKDGRFTSGPRSGSGDTAGARRIAERGGGTAGPPTKDAFGRPMTGYRNPHPVKAVGPAAVTIKPVLGYRNPHPPTQQTAAAHNPLVQQAASHVHGRSDGGTNKTRDPNYNQGEGDPELAGSVPYQVQNPAGPGFKFSSAQRQANAREMFGVGPKSRDPNYNQGEGDPELAGSVPYSAKSRDVAPKDRVYIPGVTDEFGRTAAERAFEGGGPIVATPKLPAGDFVPTPKGPDKWSQYAVARHGGLIADPYGETARTPSILVRPDPYATPRQPPVQPPKRVRTADFPETRHTSESEPPAPKAGTVLNDSRMKRLPGESSRAYVDRRNYLLRLESERQDKRRRRDTLSGKPPAFVHAKSRAGR